MLIFILKKKKLFVAHLTRQRCLFTVNKSTMRSTNTAQRYVLPALYTNIKLQHLLITT